jgi:hypothetical protein
MDGSLTIHGANGTVKLIPNNPTGDFVINIPNHTNTSLATVDDVAAKAPLDSPAFTGTPTAPTAIQGTNTTQIATTAFVLGQASSTNPLMDGIVSIGSSGTYARADHVHPSDTSKAPLDSPAFTGMPTAPTATLGTSTAQIATTAFVQNALSSSNTSIYLESAYTVSASYTIPSGKSVIMVGNSAGDLILNSGVDIIFSDINSRLVVL